MNAVLAVDDQLLSHCISLLSLRLDILVNRGRADPSKQSSILLNVLLDVSRASRILDVQVDWLVLGMVGPRARDRGENVEGENSVGGGVVNGLELAVKKARKDQQTAGSLDVRT